MRSRHILTFLALLAVGASLLAAGCGGGASSPSVASLGGTGATTTDAAPSGNSRPSSSSGSGNGQVLMIGGANALKFSRCMRAHGVSNFPDPSGQGQIQVTGIDPRSSTFQAAQQACQSLIGGGKGNRSPAQVAKAERQALAFSACMRKHGVPDFPDPTFLNGGATIHIAGNASSDLNPSSPTFQAAQQTCQGRLPAGAKTGGFSSGGPK